MSNYVVTGVKQIFVGQTAVGTQDTTMSISDNSIGSGFTFTYRANQSDNRLRPITLTQLDATFTIDGKNAATSFQAYIGAADWHGGSVQILEFVDNISGIKYFFQLKGHGAATHALTKADWQAFTTSLYTLDTNSFHEAGYQEGGLVSLTKFMNQTSSGSSGGSGGGSSGGSGGGSSGGTGTATDGHDTQNGGDGNDVIKSAGNHAMLYGGAGDDQFILGNSTASTAKTFLDGDAIFGGKGTDGLSFDLSNFTSHSTITIDLKLGSASVSGSGHTPSTLQSIENITISGANAALHNLAIVGSDGANVIDLTGSHFGTIKIDAGSGADEITGLSGDSKIDAGSGNDVIEITDGLSHILGNTGDDRIINHGVADMFADGGTGNDFIQGNNGADKMIGSNGDDTLLGGAGNDSIYGGIGADQVSGGTGNDMIYGSEGNDTLDGVAGQDTIYGGAGDDFIFGGAGNMVGIYGGDGNDNITSGGLGSKPPYAPEPALGEAMYGGNGDDTLTGDWGQNTFDGGAGHDVMQGFVYSGSSKVGDHNRDIFILSGPERHASLGISDTVTYFEAGIDKLDLSSLHTVMHLSTGGFHKTGQAQMQYSNWTGLLQADINGDGIVDWMAEVYTVDRADLHNSDFLF